MWHPISRLSRSVAPLLLVGVGVLGSAACGQDQVRPDAPAVSQPVESASPTPANPPASEAETPAADGSGGGHAHDAPHDGTLVELGEHVAQLELKLDPASGLLTLWIFDGHAEHPIRVTQPTVAVILDTPPALANRPLELAARANTLTGERVGDASEFAVTHEALRGVTTVSGRVIEVTVRGGAFRDVRFNLPAASAAAPAH